MLRTGAPIKRAFDRGRPEPFRFASVLPGNGLATGRRPQRYEQGNPQ
jgi:hypothetical protein